MRKMTSFITRTLNKNKYIAAAAGVKQTPSKTALSLTIGWFVGLAVPMGFQTMCAVPLAVAFQCNAFLAYLATNITNPLTAAPIYIFAFKVGAFIIGGGAAEKSLQSLLSDPSLNTLWNFGSNGLTAFLLGCFILAASTSGFIYIISLKFAHKFIKTPSVN
ncbi:MAG TPA: DUF2062 domain-containing protein [Ignavibacteriales bacterium]|nr:DUF2062 domain-containing protein [Ignavibacteriales bacterium]